MNNPLSTQTITTIPVEETYRVVDTVLPDGGIFKQLFQYVINDKGDQVWQLVDEKLRAIDERRREMEEQFKNATSQPSNWSQPKTTTLVPKDRESDYTLVHGGITRIDMRRALLLNLGDPQAIIKQKGLDSQRITHFKKEPKLFTLLCMMAHKHGDTADFPWRTASEFLSPPFPDSNKDA